MRKPPHVNRFEIYTKLKPAAKKAWIEALRSGEYKQTTRQLCTENGRMCCLGVAYDVTFDGVWEWQEKESYNPSGYGILDSVGYVETVGIPDEVADKIGLDNNAQVDLVDMNDIEKRSFLYIADWIEENL